MTDGTADDQAMAPSRAVQVLDRERSGTVLLACGLSPAGRVLVVLDNEGRYWWFGTENFRFGWHLLPLPPLPADGAQP